jgi:hypothetical protein
MNYQLIKNCYFAIKKFSLESTMKSLTLIFVLIFGVCAIEKARYDFYRVYEVSIQDEIHLELLKQIEEYPDGVNLN